MTEPLDVSVLLVEDNPTDVLTMKEYLSNLPVGPVHPTTFSLLGELRSPRPISRPPTPSFFCATSKAVARCGVA